MAALLIALLFCGLLSGVVQLLIIPGFLPTFLSMVSALAGVTIAYRLSRSRRYRLGAVLASAMVIGACSAVGFRDPTDHVWYAFMAIATLLGAVFLNTRGAIAVAIVAFGAVAFTMAATRGLAEPRLWLPPLMFHAVFSPLLLVMCHHRGEVERKRGDALWKQERKLSEMHRLEALGRMAGGVAHDFNNILTVVSANAERLTLRRTFDANATTEIRIACEQATRLTRQLLVFAGNQGVEPRLFNLNDVLADLQPILPRLLGDRVELRIEADSMLPEIKAVPAQLEQVILNLATNARDAMPDGGTLTITTSATTRTVQEGGEPRAAESVILRVSDTGIGMDELTQASLFEPFFSTKDPKQGGGFGLAIVRDIVVQGGGHIRVSSSLGCGATFEVILPSASGDPAPRSESPAP